MWFGGSYSSVVAYTVDHFPKKVLLLLLLSTAADDGPNILHVPTLIIQLIISTGK